MKAELSATILLTGAIFFLSSCRTSGTPAGAPRTVDRPYADAMSKHPRPFYPPIAPQSQLKVRRY
jgi:hypothetical protein